MAHKSNAMADVLMLVGGSVVGAGLGLLFAPQSGEKNRKEIVRFGRSMGKKGERVYHDVTESVSGFADTVGSKVTALRKW